MNRAWKDAARTAALWVGMMFATVVSGILVHPARHPGIPNGPMSALAAMLVVNALGAVVVAGLASRLAVSGIRKALMLIIIVFALESGFSSIESLVFGENLGLTPSMVAAIAGGGLIRATLTATFATLLWPRAAGAPAAVAAGVARLTMIVGLYVLLYFAAGMFIAWQSAAVRAFYGNGADFNLPALFAIQIGRGILWTGLIFLLASQLRGTTVAVACWSAAACAILMVAPLLYPNAIMPWAVREVHLVELAVANGLFGGLAVPILRRRKRVADPAIAATPA